jgi:branched-chain amino acid transport system permease protein
MHLADSLLQFTVSGIALGAIYGIVGLGFTIIFNATGVINFAQGEFVMLGGLVAATLVSLHVPVALALPLAGSVVAIVGLLVQRFAVQPLARSSVISMVTVTIGVSVLLRGVAKELWGPNSVAMAPFSGSQPLHLGTAAVEPQEVWVVATVLVIVVGVQLFFEHTMVGKAMRACAINRAAAQLAGVSVDRMNLLAFGLSAGISGLAGVVLAPLTMVSYSSGTSIAVKGFCAAIVGGLGNGAGALVGGILLGMLESLGAGFISSDYKNAFALLVLLLVLVLRPSGLLGKRTERGL